MWSQLMDRLLKSVFSSLIRTGKMRVTTARGLGEDTPLQRAMIEGGVFPSAMRTPKSADEFMATVADLPLAFQPGEGFLYETGFNVLGVLLVRATGKSLTELFAERITGPLGMSDTAFVATDAVTPLTPGSPGLRVPLPLLSTNTVPPRVVPRSPKL